MQNEYTKCGASLNYEAEFNRACETIECLNAKLESIESQYKGLENQLADAEKEIAHLKGQVKAFEFCVAKGK